MNAPSPLPGLRTYPYLRVMNIYLLSIAGAVATFVVGKMVYSHPLPVLSLLGLASYTGVPLMPQDITDQIRSAVLDGVTIMDVETCSDEDSAACIVEENGRYANQIMTLREELNRLAGPLSEPSSRYMNM